MPHPGDPLLSTPLRECNFGGGFGPGAMRRGCCDRVGLAWDCAGDRASERCAGAGGSYGVSRGSLGAHRGRRGGGRGWRVRVGVHIEGVAGVCGGGRGGFVMAISATGVVGGAGRTAWRRARRLAISAGGLPAAARVEFPWRGGGGRGRSDGGRLAGRGGDGTLCRRRRGVVVG